MNTMLPATTTYEHVRLDADNVPIIANISMKVVELVMAQMAYSWSPEELHFQHPYLTLGQIHSALAYYWDHKETLDADIEKRLQWAEQSRRDAKGVPLWLPNCGQKGYLREHQ